MPVSVQLAKWSVMSRSAQLVRFEGVGREKGPRRKGLRMAPRHTGSIMGEFASWLGVLGR